MRNLTATALALVGRWPHAGLTEARDAVHARPDKRVSLIWIALTCLALAACGGGGGESSGAGGANPPPPPSAANTPPSNVGLVEVSSMAVGQISASWLPAADDSTSAANLKYQLHASADSGFVPSSQTLRAETTGQTSATITSGLTPGSRYFIRLVSIDQQGAPTASNPMAIMVADTTAALNPGAVVRTLTPSEYAQVTLNTLTLVSGAATPAVGTFVASAEGAGFLRQVTAVSSSGGVTTLATRQPALNEVVSGLQVSSSMKLAPVPAAAVSAAREQALGISATPNGQLSHLGWPSTGLKYSAATASPARAATSSSGSRARPMGLVPRFEPARTTTVSGKWADVSAVSGVALEVGASGEIVLNVKTTTNEAPYFGSAVEVCKIEIGTVTNEDANARPRELNVGLVGSLEARERGPSIERVGAARQSLMIGATSGTESLSPYKVKATVYLEDFENDCKPPNRLFGDWRETIDFELSIVVGDNPFPSNEKSKTPFKSSTNVSVTSDAVVSFDPTLSYDYRLGSLSKRLDYAKIAVEASPVILQTLTVNATASGSVDETHDLIAPRKFFKVYVTPAGIPIVVSGEFKLAMQIQGDVSGALEATEQIRLGFDRLSYGVEYTGGQFVPFKTVQPLYELKLGGKGRAQATLKLSLLPSLELTLYEFATGKMVLEPYLGAGAGIEGFVQLDAAIDPAVQLPALATDADYRLTQASLTTGLDAFLFADLSAWDFNLVTWPTAANKDNHRSFEKVVLVAETPIFALPVLRATLDSAALHPSDLRALRIKADAVNVPNPLQALFPSLPPSFIAWRRWTTPRIIAPLGTPADSYAFLPSPSGDESEYWVVFSRPGTYVVRLGGFNSWGTWARQYTEVQVPVTDVNGNGILDHVEARSASVSVPTASPPSGLFASATNITVTAANAQRIYCTLRTTLDGSVPAEPPEPTEAANDPCGLVAPNYLSGSTGNFVLTAPASGTKRVKVRFRAWNTGQFGATTNSHEYQVTGGATVVVPNVPTATPPSGSFVGNSSISVIAGNAQRIYCTLRTTLDGSSPADPPEPTEASNDPCGLAAPNYISGSSGSFVLLAPASGVKRAKVRFRAWNAGQYSATTDTYAYQVSVPSQGTPDLAVGSLSFGPARVAPGGSVQVLLNVSNNGTATAAASTAVVRINQSTASSAGANLASLSVPSLPVGSGVGLPSASITAPTTPGTYQVWVLLDNGRTSGQSPAAETNDIVMASAALTVTASSGPDLVIQNLSFAPTAVVAGGPVQLNFTLANDGSSTASASTAVVRINQSSASSAGANLVTFSFSAVPAGASAPVSATVSAPTTAGSYRVWVLADNGNTAGQGTANAANDIVLASGTLTVTTTGAPDVVIQNLSFSPANPEPGSGVQVNFTFVNLGNGPAAASTAVIRINQSSTSSAGTNLATVSVGPLPVGTSASGSAVVSAPVVNGAHRVWMIADNTRTAGQTPANEANDIVLASGTLTINSPLAWGAANPTFPTSSQAATSCALPGGASSQDYVQQGDFKVYAGGCVASLSLSSAEWNSVTSGSNSFNVNDYSRRFSNSFRDSFDFIVYVLDSSDTPAALVSNGVTLRGQYLSLNTRLPTRTRRQLGSIVLTFIGSQGGLTNPIKAGPILHEIIHEWGNDGTIPASSESTPDIGSHWGFSSVGGQLGGYHGPAGVQNAGANAWAAKGPPRTCLGTATAGEISTYCSPTNYWSTNVWLSVNGFNEFPPNSIPYGPLERFIAGFMPLSSLPSITYATNGAWVDQVNGLFTASGFATLAPSEIVTRMGSRAPNYAASQKNFRIAVVVLTPNQLVAANRLQDLNASLTEFSRDGTPQWGSPSANVIWLHNFFTATGGGAAIRAGNLLGEIR